MSKNPSVEASSHIGSNEAEIRNLLRQAGARPLVAPEDLASARGAARDQWRQLVRMERERVRFARKNTFLALAASLLVAVALGWWMMPEWGAHDSAVVASVERMLGELRVDGVDVSPGDEIAAGAVLETGRDGSGAALRLVGTQSVRFDAGTRVRLISEASFELERGAAYVDTHGAAIGSGLLVSTPFGSVRDIGTQFLIRLGDGSDARLRVLVREGEIVLERESGRHSAVAGVELTVRRESDVVDTVAIDRHGEAWDWVEDVAPAMDIEGARLSEYLEWVSRETGRELRYGDPSLADSSRTITLSGSIAGLTPEESLSILPGSGLDHRIENGWLLIERPSAR